MAKTWIVPAVAVGGRESAFPIQSFAVLEVHGLSRHCIAKGHMDIACDILPKVDDEIPGSVAHGGPDKALMLPHGDALVFAVYRQFNCPGAERVCAALCVV